MRRVAGGLLLGFVLLALLAPSVSPNDPQVQSPDRTFAPPMRVHVRDSEGWQAPFVYRQVLVDRISRTYTDSHDVRVPLQWFVGGRLVSVAADRGPLLLCGADAVGRDLCARLAYGARLSLGVAVLGACGALLLGAWLGATAGTFGGRVDTLVMTVADFVLVLPVVYLAIVLRATRPLVMDTGEMFVLMSAIFAGAAWPDVARGVRSVVASERSRDYAEAARAVGAGPCRLVGHLLPAAYGFLRIEFVLLVPALLIAESTLSFVGFGFEGAIPSWGGLLKDSEALTAMYSAPWLLIPAVALFVVVLALQTLAGAGASAVNIDRARTHR
ncbi:MAG: ABC transporter permease [Acidobacteria bacterium]|jgi:peptide/nickel transport system permease protein|nr:ABC transporter permease [Acidobacteriota bacterium]